MRAASGNPVPSKHTNLYWIIGLHYRWLTQRFFQMFSLRNNVEGIEKRIKVGLGEALRSGQCFLISLRSLFYNLTNQNSSAVKVLVVKRKIHSSMGVSCGVELEHSGSRALSSDFYDNITYYYPSHPQITSQTQRSNRNAKCKVPSQNVLVKKREVVPQNAKSTKKNTAKNLQNEFRHLQKFTNCFAFESD